uniref:Uncharacterized protein n=1 Tax=Siphoviridae sp. ctTnV63 TaxID=2825523 RepID=A0A8S5NV19_9CAUD|nr:MAG TPA: hypothetical protein [Siphoviridae sp. ctTnV63]
MPLFVFFVFIISCFYWFVKYFYKKIYEKNRTFYKSGFLANMEVIKMITNKWDTV